MLLFIFGLRLNQGGGADSVKVKPGGTYSVKVKTGGGGGGADPVKNILER